MVFYAPDASQVLGPALQELVAGVNHAINPNYAFQEGMKAHLAQNPELAQKLSDLEANAPGTLSKLGFGHLADAITSIPQSPASVVAQTNRGTIIDTGNKQVAGQNAEAGFDLDRLNDTINFLKDPANADIKSDVVLKKLTGQTAAGRSTSQSEATSAAAAASSAPAEARARTAKAGEEVDQADVQQRAFEDVQNQYPELKGLDPMRMVRDMLAGRDVPEFQTYMSLPGGSQAMGLAVSLVNAQENRDLQALLRAQTKDGEDKTNIQNAANFLRASRAGTLNAWRTVLEHPDQVAAIRAKKPVDMTQDDKDVIHAADAQQQMQDKLELNKVQETNASLRSASSQVATSIKAGASDADINIGIGSINNILAQKGQATGQIYRAVYGSPPAIGESQAPGHTFLHPFTGPPPQLFYVDGSGKRVEDNAPFAEPKTGTAKLSADALRAYSQIQGVDADKRQAAFEKLKKANPILAGQIAEFIK